MYVAFPGCQSYNCDWARQDVVCILPYGIKKVHVFVNALQVASNVIVQNSTREGFGLSLAEAMWKGKAAIGGRAEGIKLQIENSKNGFWFLDQKS